MSVAGCLLLNCFARSLLANEPIDLVTHFLENGHCAEQIRCYAHGQAGIIATGLDRFLYTRVKMLLIKDSGQWWNDQRCFILIHRKMISYFFSYRIGQPEERKTDQQTY